MNPFYQIPKIFQWLIALILFAFMLMVFNFFDLVLETNVILGIIVFFLIIPIMQFCATPFFKLIGLYQYLSPMLLALGSKQKKIDLHSGTSFDYLMVMRKYKAGVEARSAILAYYLEGLLVIISEIENGKIPETLKVEGTSYFFSESTANRLGFDISKGGSFLKVNLYLNFIDLFWTYSYSQGKLSIPDLRNIKKASTTGKRLVDNKVRIEKLYRYLKKKQLEIE